MTGRKELLTGKLYWRQNMRENSYSLSIERTKVSSTASSAASIVLFPWLNDESCTRLWITDTSAGMWRPLPIRGGGEPFKHTFLNNVSILAALCGSHSCKRPEVSTAVPENKYERETLLVCEREKERDRESVKSEKVWVNWQCMWISSARNDFSRSWTETVNLRWVTRGVKIFITERTRRGGDSVKRLDVQDVRKHNRCYTDYSCERCILQSNRYTVIVECGALTMRKNWLFLRVFISTDESTVILQEENKKKKKENKQTIINVLYTNMSPKLTI